MREEAHYQCVFYGGRLLAHLSAEVPGEGEPKLIKILSTNRKAIMLIDSDKRTESDPINDTKERICKEIEEINGLCWITSGREVENYIPKISVSKLYEIEVQKDLGLYDNFWSYLDEIKPGEGLRYSQKKVMFAEKIRPYLDRQDLGATFDLEKRMVEIIERIKKWNNIT